MDPHESTPKAEFLPLFMSNEANVRAFIRTLVSDPQMVDDVFQAVALVLWQKFDTYDRERPFGPWARGVAAKEVLAMRRGMARCPTPFSPDVVVSILDEFDRFVDSRGMTSERTEALERCIEALPAPSQEMLKLRYGRSVSIRRWPLPWVGPSRQPSGHCREFESAWRSALKTV